MPEQNIPIGDPTRYNNIPRWLRPYVSSFARAVMGLNDRLEHVQMHYNSMNDFERCLLEIVAFEPFRFTDLNDQPITIQNYFVAYNDQAESICQLLDNGIATKTDIINGGLLMTTRIPDDYAVCMVTKITLPKSEMVEIDRENSWGETEGVGYIHPSVIDNSELSDYITTVTGKVDTRYNCYLVPAHNDQPEIYIRHRDSRHSRTLTRYNLFHCHSCGTPHYITERNNLDYSGEDICNTCINEYYMCCPECDEYVNTGTYEEEGCPSCGHNRAAIHDYSYKPSPVFEGVTTRFSPYIGFELELEARRNSTPKELASMVNSAFSEDILYNKYDSSLDSGLEIVSHPLTLDAHAKKNYRDLFESLSKAGARSHNTSTCGLHFHLDKRSMSDAHKVRFGAFFALARHKLEVLARRRSEDYAAFKNKACSLSEFIAEDNRYLAVNWTNRHTVEVRIFRGTLKYETFMACMQLCQAIFAFTGKASSFVCDFEENVMWSRFMGFIDSTKGTRYDHLKQYIIEKKDLLNQAIAKDEDIIKVEKTKEVKRKKLRLTNNVIRATLERERGNRRLSPFLYEPDNAYMEREIAENYNFFSSDPIRIDLETNEYGDL